MSHCVTGVLLWHYGGVMSHCVTERCRSVTVALRGCYGAVRAVSPGCSGTYMRYEGCAKGMLRVCRECITGIEQRCNRMLRTYTEVLRVYHGGGT